MSKKVLVEGEVRVRNSSGVVEIQFYEEEFNLDDSVQTLAQARQIIKRGLITHRLSKKIAGLKSVRTIDVTTFEDSTEKAENAELDVLLTKAVELQCVPANIDNYKRPDYKIKALEKAIKNAQERIEKAKKKKSNVEDQGYVD